MVPVEFTSSKRKTETNMKQKKIPQWEPTEAQRKHLELQSSMEGTTLTGYIKQLVNADMKKKK